MLKTLALFFEGNKHKPRILVFSYLFSNAGVSQRIADQEKNKK